MIQSLKDTEMATLSEKNYAITISMGRPGFVLLMLDRFSDNNEAGFAENGTTTLFTTNDSGNAIITEEEAKTWSDARS